MASTDPFRAGSGKSVSEQAVNTVCPEQEGLHNAQAFPAKVTEAWMAAITPDDSSSRPQPVTPAADPSP
ncbi:hypothetical protein P7K49_036965 [Saguinus oedipus]|uniref:Uncharacterized protein n=1 Tax=Saguinus oedipus TaxID=9490 RepID=A0ABQ9TM73_SAGOE|nr:hypothetical protein P7K49_036965 [Saguinus oedipus]